MTSVGFATPAGGGGGGLYVNQTEVLLSTDGKQ